MPVRCIVFDCDGVLLDSVPAKTRAFARLAEPYGEEARDRFVLFHHMHGGVSRYKKFEWFFREVIGREITKAEYEEWGRRFAEHCLDEVRRCPLIPGIEAVLRRWSGRLPLYVCSGTPTAELRDVLKLRGLDGYFADILGSPPEKAKVLENIVRSTPFDPADVLMVGDAPTDRDAAEAVGTMFYGRGPDLVNDGLFPWEETLEGLDGWLAAHV